MNCRRNPRRNERRSTRSRRSDEWLRHSWSSPPGHRRSATACWIRPPASRHGYSTMTRTATTRSPARSSTVSPDSLPRETIVDNITLYWLTGTGTSAARWYWEFGQVLATAGASGEAPPPVKVPVGFTTFPGEIGLPRAAGLRRSTPAWPTSTRSSEADTSQRGRNPTLFARSSALRLDPCVSSHGSGLARPIGWARSGAFV